MPTDIAFSACVAAATISLKEIPEDIKNMITDEVKIIVKMMINLSDRMNIEIGPEEIEAEEIEEPQMVGAISAVEPTKHMNFELKWAFDVPPLEVAPVEGRSKTVTIKKNDNFEEVMDSEIENNSDTKIIFKVSVRVGTKTFERWKQVVKNNNRMLGRNDEVRRIEMEHKRLLSWAEGAIIGKKKIGNY